jgi:hypothetical protein
MSCSEKLRFFKSPVNTEGNMLRHLGIKGPSECSSEEFSESHELRPSDREDPRTEGRKPKMTDMVIFVDHEGRLHADAVTAVHALHAILVVLLQPTRPK